MNPVDAFHSALEALRRNPMRTLLTTLGLVIGTAAVIALIAVGDGARERLMAQIRNLGSNLIVITPGSRTVGAARLATGSRQNLTVEDAAAIAQEIPSLELAVPFFHSDAGCDKYQIPALALPLASKNTATSSGRSSDIAP